MMAAVLLLAGWAFHAQLLRGMAHCLVVEDRPAPAAAMLLLDGDRRFDVAAELYREGANEILVYRSRNNRLVRMEILLSGDELARRELLKRGVPSEGLLVLSGESDNRSATAEALCEWLRQQPDRKVNVLCDRFTSRTWKLVFRRAADPSIIERIRIVAIPNRRYDETNWWRSKSGIMAFANGFLRLGFHWCRSGKEAEITERTQAEFRAAFAGGAAP